jgi:hypothetical protein
MPRSEKRRSGVMTLPGITRRRLLSNDTWQWFATIKLTASLLAQMARQKIHRNAGRAKALVRLHHEGRRLIPECHLRHLMMMGAPKQKVWHPPMSIYILHFPALNFRQGWHVRQRFCSRFADSWWFFHRFVHYQLHGNVVDNHFDDEGSHLRESDSKDKSWLKGTGLLSIIVTYN